MTTRCIIIHGNNLRGLKSGKLTALEPTEQRSSDGCIIWICKCDCGNDTFVSSHLLAIKAIRSCGCLQVESARSSLVKARKVNMIDGTNIGLIKEGKKTRSDNSSGATGVRWDKRYNKWVAEIVLQGKKYYLGMCKNFDEAVDIRKTGEIKYFGKFSEEHSKKAKS